MNVTKIKYNRKIGNNKVDNKELLVVKNNKNIEKYINRCDLC